jgi:1,4-alpha-glucan branching enzyme
MYAHPGTKLLFMGCEFAQTSEWNFASQLSWELLNFEPHEGMRLLVKDLNHLYKNHVALYEYQFEQKGFEWLDFSNHENCIISFIRKSDDLDESIVTVCNFNVTPHEKYRLGVPQKGIWEVLINTDDKKYWGSGYLSVDAYTAEKKMCHGRIFSIELSLPPMAVVMLKLK